MTTLPLAMSPTQRTPGVAVLIDFLAEATSAGSASLRGLIIAPKASTGSITSDTEIVQGLAGAAGASTYLGAGSPGHLAAKALFRELPLANIDLISPTPSTGAFATGTFTFDDSQGSSTDITAARTVTATIAGREISIQWLVGETREQAATKLVTAISAASDDLPVSAANAGGTSAVCTITSKVKGTWGNDILTYVDVSGGTGGSVVAGAAAMASGAGEMDITTALTKIINTEYDFILLVTSNADAVSASTSNPSRLKSYLDTYGEGQPALLQQGIYACTSTLSGLKAATAVINYGRTQVLLARTCQSLPCEWAAAEMGARMRERAKYAVKNRIHMVYRATLYGPRDHVTSDLSAVEIEDALQHGITPITFNSTFVPWPERPITTYWKDTSAAPDDRILDVTRVDGMFTVAKDLRSTIPAQFQGKSLSPDLPTGDDQLPPDVVEIGTVRAFVVARCRLWQGRGVLRKDKLDEAIGTRDEPGELQVVINETDATQVDMLIPLATIPPLAKFSMYFTQAA